MWISVRYFHDKFSHHSYYLIQLDQPFITAPLPQIRINLIVSMFNTFFLRLFSQELLIRGSSTNMIVSLQTWTANTSNQWSIIILKISTHNTYFLLNVLGFILHISFSTILIRYILLQSRSSLCWVKINVFYTLYVISLCEIKSKISFIKLILIQEKIQ